MMSAALLEPVSSVPAFADSVHLGVQHHTVHPGQHERVTVRGLSALAYQIDVTMPDGEGLSSGPKTRVRPGVIRWSFIQPPGTITRESRRAVVRLVVGNQTYKTNYAIAFGPIDVVVPRQPVPENSVVTLWVHTLRGPRSPCS
jgi:hypothetical protein